MKRDDALWKGLIEDLADDFLKFFFSNAEEIFDFNRKISFLDKELEQLFPNTQDEFSPKYVDKLMKVYSKKGKEEWILVHIEVQGSTDKTFARRMFTYYYRILDKYNRKITALAILTDKNKSFHPTHYKSEFMGTEIYYKFNTYKALDADVQELEKNNNPFATVIEVVQTALLKGRIPDVTLYDLKINLLRKLLRKNFSKEKIAALLRFLKLYVRFENKDLIHKFDEDLDTITNRPNVMGLKEFVLDRERRMARKEGLQEGRDEGIIMGKEEGREEGVEIGISKASYEKDFTFVKSLLENTDFDNAKIMLLTGVTKDFIKHVKEKLNQ